MPTMLTYPNGFVENKIREAALDVLSWSMAVEGVSSEGIAWKITPTNLTHIQESTTVQVSILTKGRWNNLGSFALHITTMDTIVEYLETAIQKQLKGES